MKILYFKNSRLITNKRGHIKLQNNLLWSKPTIARSKHGIIVWINVKWPQERNRFEWNFDWINDPKEFSGSAFRNLPTRRRRPSRRRRRSAPKDSWSWFGNPRNRCGKLCIRCCALCPYIFQSVVETPCHMYSVSRFTVKSKYVVSHSHIVSHSKDCSASYSCCKIKYELKITGIQHIASMNGIMGL